MKIENLCIHCMKEKHSADEICPFCGSDPKSADIPPYHLQPFSILAGKYLLGMAIGEGGFGITYIGMDLNLEMRVAIKNRKIYRIRREKMNGFDSVEEALEELRNGIRIY